MTRIFLAASNELYDDRRAFERDIHRRTQLWGKRGYSFQIDVWEDFDDSMSPTRKQDDYNAAIKAADLFVLLVHTKMGKYSLEEFEVAWAQFLTTTKVGPNNIPGKPRIFTYIKGMPEAGEPDPGPEYHTVRAFLARLTELGHWPNKYDEISQMLHHFGTQLERLWALGVIESTTPVVNDSKDRHVQIGAGARKAISKRSKGAVITGQVDLHSGGGAVVLGAVEAGGDFVGRDRTSRTEKEFAGTGRAATKRKKNGA